jgi:hypothetical protein
MLRKLLLLISLICCTCIYSGAYELEAWGAAADNSAFFVNITLATYNYAGDTGFDTSMPEISFDYVLPFLAPLSIGGFFRVPEPNLKSFGPRIALHPNIGMKNIDVYALYIHDFGYIRNEDLISMNDTPVEKLYYDFRAGARYVFSLFCIAIESNYKFSGVNFVLSFKVN